MILTFLLSNWRWIVLAALLTSNTITYELWRHSANGFAQYKADVAAVAKIQAKETQTKIQTQQNITEDVRNGYASAVDYLRTHPQRVLVHASCPVPVPAVSGPAQGADDAGGGPVLTAASVTQDCAEAVLELNRLQDWAEKQERLK